MVKKVELEQKKSPLRAIYGLIIAVGLFLISYGISSEFIVGKVPQVRDVVSQMGRPTATILFGVAIWLVLLAFTFFLVAMIVGRDPKAANQIPLPPKASDKRKQRR